MVFSVFAGTVALSGSAVASHGNADAALSDSTTYWQGQTLGIDVSGVSADSDGVFQIRTDDGDLVTEVTTDDQGHLTIDSSVT